MSIPFLLLAVRFAVTFLAQLGFAPRMDECGICGRRIDGDARFDAGLGGAVCLSCPSSAPFISNGARRILMKLPRTGYDKVALLDGHPDWPEAARLYRTYVNRRLRQEKFAPPLAAE